MAEKAKSENTKWRLTCHKELVLQIDEKCWDLRIKTRHQLVERIVRLALRLLEPEADGQPTQFERLEMAFASEEGEEKHSGAM